MSYGLFYTAMRLRACIKESQPRHFCSLVNFEILKRVGKMLNRRHRAMVDVQPCVSVLPPKILTNSQKEKKKKTALTHILFAIIMVDKVD